MPYEKISPIDYMQHRADALSTSVKGSLNELIACAYFLKRGYEVFRNVSPTGDGDIVLWKRGIAPIVFDVKAIGVVGYIRDDGTSRKSTCMNKSKCPGVVTVGVTRDGEVVCGDGAWSHEI